MTSSMFNLPVLPAIISIVILSFIFVTKGNYKINQNIMLLSSFFYVVYIFLRLKQNQTGWPPSPIWLFPMASTSQLSIYVTLLSLG